jgi:hypothetical protein
LTSFLAACASAAGAGIVLGGLIVGVAGMVLGWSREGIDFQVREGGYWGGVIGLGALFADHLS